ncbi:MAG: GGDEF domain-containing protein [Smithella sp.]|jgi:diguanylate cyclase (GGDEF)-like protein
MTFERHKMNKRVVQDLKKRSTIGILFYIVLSFIIVFADNFHERHLIFSMFFLLSMGGICLFRLVHLVVSPKMGESYEALNKNIFFASVIITGLIWGVTYALIMLQKGEYVTQFLMSLCVCGLCAGGVVAFIPHRRLSIFFNISMLMPATITVLVSGLNISLTVMIFLFSVYMVLIAYRGNREYWNALENEYLLEIKSREMERLSNTDVLTGLYNRRYFDEAFDREWKRSGRDNSLLSIILFDIDHFKNVNDTFGHQAGDEYLKKTAETMTSVFKRDYDIVARYGGEEFMVLLPGINADHASQMAEKVRKKIESMILDHRGKKVGATISAGIMCCVPNFNTIPDFIISCVDQALYIAKLGGRNRVAVYPPTSGSNDT